MRISKHTKHGWDKENCDNKMIYIIRKRWEITRDERLEGVQGPRYGHWRASSGLLAGIGCPTQGSAPFGRGIGSWSSFFLESQFKLDYVIKTIPTLFWSEWLCLWLFGIDSTLIGVLISLRNPLKVPKSKKQSWEKPHAIPNKAKKAPISTQSKFEL